jgi:hypothetical protein
MKPSSPQLQEVRSRIATAHRRKGLSNAEIGRMANVHPSQVGRICGGDFKTFSHNVVRICKALDVRVPRLEPSGKSDAAWVQVQSSIRRIWDETPEGAKAIARMLDAVADIKKAQRE